jgi:hypothetical protein
MRFFFGGGTTATRKEIRLEEARRLIARHEELCRLMREAAETAPGSQMRYVDEFMRVRDAEVALGLNVPPTGSHLSENHDWFGTPGTCWLHCHCLGPCPWRADNEIRGGCGYMDGGPSMFEGKCLTCGHSSAEIEAEIAAALGPEATP